MDIIQYFERNYKSLLLCAVMMIKDVDKAQDILHSVAVGLLTRKDELSELRHPSAFIAQCIYRATLVLAETCPHPGPSVAYDYVEWVASIEAYLQKYSPQMRQAFVDHYLDGVPVGTIAAKLGLTPNALTLRLKRMRDTIAKEGPDMLRHIEILSLF